MATEASFFQLFKIIAVMGNIGTRRTVEKISVSPGEYDLILESKGLKHEGESDIKSSVCLSFVLDKLVGASYTLVTTSGKICMEGTLGSGATEQDMKNLNSAIEGFKKKAKVLTSSLES